MDEMYKMIAGMALQGLLANPNREAHAERAEQLADVALYHATELCSRFPNPTPEALPLADNEHLATSAKRMAGIAWSIMPNSPHPWLVVSDEAKAVWREATASYIATGSCGDGLDLEAQAAIMLVVEAARADD